jgi:hypothetical protein
MKDSLFGHLAFGFSSSPENLATEALCYILNRSNEANKAFVRFVSQANNALPSSLKFETQLQVSGNLSNMLAEDKDSTSSGNFRPDIVGKDTTGKNIVIGEIKFWAALTSNQPVKYLKGFPDSSVLVFIAPTKRLTLLLDELKRRCKAVGLEPQKKEDFDDEFKTLTFANYPILALTSWRKVINSILHAVETDGDTNTLSDIMQLQGLCDRMDETAFLPIQSEELTSDIGKRILQYCDLVDEVTERLVNSGVAVIKGLQKTSWGGATGRYMFIHGHGCLLHFNSQLWRDFGGTPIWFQIQKSGTGKSWSFASEAKTKLIKLELEEPSRLLHIEDRLYVPISILTGVEKSDIIKSMLSRLQEVIDIVGSINE